jgi:putative mRNA 3-end processing factor
VEALMEPYREAGVPLPPTKPLSAVPRGESLAGRLVIAPPSAHRSPWMKRLKLPQTAFVSGWMAVRGARRRRGYERGFVLSDHADWPGLLRTVRDCGARQVYVTHGNSDGLARYLREVEGISAEPLAGAFAAERGHEETEEQGIDGMASIGLPTRGQQAAVDDPDLVNLRSAAASETEHNRAGRGLPGSEGAAAGTTP